MYIQVDLNFNLVECKTGGLSGGGGISATGTSEGALPGFIGSLAYSQRNLFGLNQKLALSAEIGQVCCELLQFWCGTCSSLSNSAAVIPPDLLIC